MKKKIGDFLELLGFMLSIVAIPSFFFFLVFTILIGGDALNGYMRHGEYFVCSHGECKEVWPLIFNISWYSGIVMVSAFIPMCLLCAAGRALQGNEASEIEH
ncbi:hypothetical protein [Roseibium album]|uniref:hypothetical protein n=1 Tax=Roseibium album TaxID=311410 RepID=UPI00391D85F6